MNDAAVVELLESVLRLGRVDETSVSYLRRRSGASRFASNTFTQCVDTDEAWVEVRVALGGRVGTARTGTLKGAALARAHEQAREIAAAQPPADGFAGFPEAESARVVEGWAESTAKATAEDRAQSLRPVFHAAQQRRLSCAGLFLTAESERAVASSRGVRCHARDTFSRVEIIAAENGASGYASAAHRDVRELEIERLAEHAFVRARLARDPVEVPSGRHDVLLEPPAVREILEWLGTTAFQARSIQDGTSALAGRMGELIVGENVTIVDDPNTLANGSTPRPFDSEGVPSRPVTLIERGKAAGFVSDAATAALLGLRSTGHAASISDELADMPGAAHLHVLPGDTPRGDLVERLGKGLLVPRFHYVNGLLDTRRALMTGLTRDGLFRVENGRVCGAARNLRWMESIVDAFGRIEAISREVETVPTWWSDGAAFVVPAMLVRGWTFTSQAG